VDRRHPVRDVRVGSGELRDARGEGRGAGGGGRASAEGKGGEDRGEPIAHDGEVDDEIDGGHGEGEEDGGAWQGALIPPDGGEPGAEAEETESGEDEVFVALEEDKAEGEADADPERDAQERGEKGAARGGKLGVAPERHAMEEEVDAEPVEEELACGDGGEDPHARVGTIVHLRVGLDTAGVYG
jgi:hypothetical protein